MTIKNIMNFEKYKYANEICPVSYWFTAVQWNVMNTEILEKLFLSSLMSLRNGFAIMKYVSIILKKNKYFPNMKVSYMMI